MMFSKHFYKLFSIHLLLFLLFSILIVKSSESVDDYDNKDEDNGTNFSNSSLKSNSSDDYEYSDNVEDCPKETFLDRARKLHEEGRHLPLTKNVKHINETFALLDNVKSVFRTLIGFNDREKHKLLEFLSEISFNVSPDCMNSMVKVFQGIQNTELWAIKMLDSLGSFPPSGFAEGVIADFGEYEECLDVKSPSTADKQPVIRGQYCIMKVVLPYPNKDGIDTNEQSLNEEIKLDDKYKSDIDLQNLTLKTIIETLNIVNGAIYRMGVCMPNTCSAEDFEDIINKLFRPITRLPVEIDRASCAVRDQPVLLDNYEMIAMMVLCLLVFLVIMSTFADIYKKYRQSEMPQTKHDLVETKGERLLYSFSIIRSTGSLFASTHEKWQSLDTIRLLLIIYVYIAHFYIAATTLGLITMKNLFSVVIPRMFRDPRYWFARNPLMIDALYALSGFLIGYGLLRKLDRSGGRFRYFQFIAQQWIRFTVLSFGCLLFFYMFRFTGEGPVWYYGVEYNTGCKNPWQLFRIATFLNNFYEFRFETFHQTCNLPLWFLSALMQYLIISPAFIILYWRRPTLGKYVMIAVIAFTNISAILPYFVIGVKPYLQILIHGAKLLSSNANDSINWYHTYPNVQAQSYFIGIAAGFIMKKGIGMNRAQVKLCWLLSFLGIVLVYAWQASFWRSGETEPVVGALLWHTVGKFIFAVSFSWVLVGLCSGRGYYLDVVLSWSGFRPLARLSFGIYLLHFLLIGHRLFDTKYTFHASDRLIWQFITIDLIWVIFLAYIYYILIEGPFTNVFRLLYPSESIAPTNKKPHIEIHPIPESNNNGIGARDLNGFVTESCLSVTVGNGSVNQTSELSKL